MIMSDHEKRHIHSRIIQLVMQLDEKEWHTLSLEQQDHVDDIATDLQEGATYTKSMGEELQFRGTACQVLDKLAMLVGIFD